MSLGRPRATLELTVREQEELAGFAASRSLPHALVARARLVLWSAEGRSNSEIATRLRCSKATVGKWRQRFIRNRIRALYDGLHPGHPRSISDAKVATLLRCTLKTKWDSSQAACGTHWSVRQAAGVNRLSKIHRALRLSDPCPAARIAAKPHTYLEFAVRKLIFG